MPLVAGSVFFGSLFLITLLFMIKGAEAGTSAKLAPKTREFFDDAALYIKAVLVWMSVRASRIPPTVALLARFAIHQGALGAARLSRTIERAAHNVADLVSHKHRFERRETKSQYLKEVGEHPMRSREDEPQV